jgi:hypothetical protein
MDRRIAAFLCLTACSTATIERSGLPNLEGRIVASDERSVYVLGDEGQTFAVPRRTLRDIDHPGNVLLTVGGVLLAFAGISYLSTGSASNEDEQARKTANLFGAIGAPLFLGGIIPWLMSSRAAANFGPEVAVPDAIPLAELPGLASPTTPPLIQPR